MLITEKQELDFPRIYTIHSQKGGVGKTSVALALGGMTAIWHAKKTLVIDADLTGVSLADIPIWGDKPLVWHFFNDLIMAPPHKFAGYTAIPSDSEKHDSPGGLSQFYHKAPDCDGLYVMASSPRFRDIARIIPLISQEDALHFFRHRLEDILIRAFEEGFESIVIDHPPGLYGISLASLGMILRQICSRNDLHQRPEDHKPTRLDRLYRFKTQETTLASFVAEAILITSQDSADYRALFPYFAAVLSATDQGRILMVLKDLKEGINILLNKVEERADPRFIYDQILGNLDFREQDGRAVHPNVLDYLKRRGKAVGVTTCRGVGNFDISRILSSIQALKSKNLLDPGGGMESWCLDVARSVGLYSASPASI